MLAWLFGVAEEHPFGVSDLVCYTSGHPAHTHLHEIHTRLMQPQKPLFINLLHILDDIEVYVASMHNDRVEPETKLGLPIRANEMLNKLKRGFDELADAAAQTDQSSTKRTAIKENAKLVCDVERYRIRGMSVWIENYLLHRPKK